MDADARVVTIHSAGKRVRSISQSHLFVIIYTCPLIKLLLLNTIVLFVSLCKLNMQHLHQNCFSTNRFFIFGIPDSMYRRAEIWENPSHVKQDTAEIVTDSTKPMTPNHFWEDLLDIGNFTPLSHSLSEALPSSASPSTSNYPNVSLSQSNQTSFHKSSAGQLRWRYSPMNFTPQLCDNKAANEFCSSGCELDGQMKDDDMPRILKDGSTPKKAFKASSPTQKRVSPPQYRLEELRSRSNSPGLRSGRKFILQAVPSFPPLTPYSKSKDGISRCGTDFNDSTDD